MSQAESESVMPAYLGHRERRVWDVEVFSPTSQYDPLWNVHVKAGWNLVYSSETQSDAKRWAQIHLDPIPGDPTIRTYRIKRYQALHGLGDDAAPTSGPGLGTGVVTFLIGAAAGYAIAKL